VRRFLYPILAAAVAATLISIAAAPLPDTFHFVILGDRTGEAQPGVYERIWRETAAENPAFVLTVGDTIEGLNDAAAPIEWRKVEQILLPYRRFPLYLTPGNHDIWSQSSESLFRKFAGHPPHYSFDFQQAHFTILDNSRSDQFSPDEMQFLEKDLEAHAAQPVKFVVSHRPSWLIDAAFVNSRFPLHQLAKKYGVQYVLAGHIHQMIHIDLEEVSYISLPSAGGHLRLSEQYQDGWFFARTLADVSGTVVNLQIKELGAPYGQGRVTSLHDWGRAGLAARSVKAGAK
jgi:UDP-2,3-diacylglucosamine pyrophosphatase LpxH